MAHFIFPQIDPILFSVGPLSIRWYGLMYVLGFIACYLLVQYQTRRHHYKQLEDNLDNLNTVLILCVILGGRLGYVLFYNFAYYVNHPVEILATWNGGMSFHGACLTVIIGGYLFCRMKKINFWKAADIYIVTVPIGLGLGRIGNLINGELYGRVTDQPWGVIFPYAGMLPRHPSQIYESIAEGLILFILLWNLRNIPWQQKKFFPHGSILALFLIFYGFFRIIIENFREPDAQIGFILGKITMGQLLSSAMILLGLVIWVILINRHKSGQSH